MTTKKTISLIVAGLVMSVTVAVNTVGEKIVPVDTLEMVKREIVIDSVDKVDHSKDKFLVQSDSSDYEDGLSGTDVYFSVTNTGKPESGSINFKFDGAGRPGPVYAYSQIEEAELIPTFKEGKEIECAPFADKEAVCYDQIQDGYETVTTVEDEWTQVGEDYVFFEGTTFFKSHIRYTQGSAGKFDIEVVGDFGGYGNLDPNWGSGWLRRASITVDNTKVGGTGDLTDFPILLNIDNLPSEMFDADGSYPAKSDGCDLRFSTDEAGDTELPLEIVDFSTGNNMAYLQTYTKSVAPTSYPDTGDSELTDGILGTDAYTNSAWVGWYLTTTVAMTIDLGSSQSLDHVRFHYLVDNASGIYHPTQMVVTGSNNDVDYDSLGTFTTSDWYSGSTKDIYWSDDLDVSGSYRYVKMNFTLYNGGNNWLFLDELQVLSSAGSTNKTAEVWVKVPTLDYNDDTVIYAWYGKSDASCYAVDATYGAQNVWDANFEMVHHLSGAAYTDLDDSTSNGVDVVSQNGTPDYDSTGIFSGGKGVHYAGSEFNNIDTTAANPANDFTVEAFAKYDSAGSSSYEGILTRYLSSYRGYILTRIDTEEMDFYTTGSLPSGTTYADTDWHHVVGTIDGSNGQTLYVDGVSEATVTRTVTNNVTGWTIAGIYYNNSSLTLQGSVDEIRFSTTERSGGWVTTTYNTTFAPDTFATAGTPETPEGPSGTIQGISTLQGISTITF